MLSNLSVVSAAQDRLLVHLAGIESLTESVHRDTDGPSTSALVVTFSGVQISGMISYLYYEVYDGNNCAVDNIEFITVPSGLDTITIAGTVYTFRTTLSGLTLLSGINSVPIQKTAENCAVALFRVVNAVGTAGTDYLAGQTANPYVSGIYPDNPLSFRVIASGLGGDNYAITTTSSAILIGNPVFSRGRDVPFTNTLFHGAILISGTNPTGNGTVTIQDIPYSSVGEGYLIHIWFATISGVQALDTNGNLFSYWMYAPRFTGRTSLPYYAEVSGLNAYNLFSGGIPSNGVVGLMWTPLLQYYARSGQPVMLGAPAASGIQVQLSGLYSYATQGQQVDYVIFVFQSTSGSAPEEAWPRTVDANGTWYYAGKTFRTSTTLVLPPESASKFSIWVGFGNKDTRKTSGLPFRSVLSSIYIE